MIYIAKRFVILVIKCCESKKRWVDDELIEGSKMNGKL